MAQHHTKIREDLSNSKSLLFNVKKLLKDNVDLTPKLRGGKKRRVSFHAAEPVLR
jgi:hypothetical protein